MSTRKAKALILREDKLTGRNDALRTARPWPCASSITARPTSDSVPRERFPLSIVSLRAFRRYASFVHRKNYSPYTVSTAGSLTLLAARFSATQE